MHLYFEFVEGESLHKFVSGAPHTFNRSGSQMVFSNRSGFLFVHFAWPRNCPSATLSPVGASSFRQMVQPGHSLTFVLRQPSMTHDG